VTLVFLNPYGIEEEEGGRILDTIISCSCLDEPAGSCFFFLLAAFLCFSIAVEPWNDEPSSHFSQRRHFTSIAQRQLFLDVSSSSSSDSQRNIFKSLFFLFDFQGEIGQLGPACDISLGNFHRKS
jgi:hypothetical protein